MLVVCFGPCGLALTCFGHCACACALVIVSWVRDLALALALCSSFEHSALVRRLAFGHCL